MFTEEQFKSAVRWALTLLGTFLVTHGVGSDALWEPIIGAAITLVPFVWSMIRHTKIGTILAANSLDEVQGVVTKATPDGKELAAEIPLASVAPAGSTDAAFIAKAA